MWRIFTAQSKHKQKAKFAAILWTLLIFFACFVPGNEIPHVRVPMADKWVHFILFGVFSFLWLLASPGISGRKLVTITLCACALGWIVEELQGMLPSLGRSRDMKDMLADSIGGVLGTLLFYLLALPAARRSEK